MNTQESSSLGETRQAVLNARKEVKLRERAFKLQQLEMKAAQEALKAARHQEMQMWFAYEAMMLKEGKLKPGERARIEKGGQVHEAPKTEASIDFPVLNESSYK